MSLMAETDFPVKNNRMRISLNFDGELNPELSSGSLYPKAYIPSDRRSDFVDDGQQSV